MIQLYKAITKAEDYPEQRARVVPIGKGDSFYITANAYKNKQLKLGDPYFNQNGIVVEIYYVPKKWWMFWKRKVVMGYRIEWT